MSKSPQLLTPFDKVLLIGLAAVLVGICGLVGGFWWLWRNPPQHRSPAPSLTPSPPHPLTSSPPPLFTSSPSPLFPLSSQTFHRLEQNLHHPQ